MKMSLTKLLALAIWLPSLLLISFSGYFLYDSYLKYNQTEKSIKYLNSAKKNVKEFKRYIERHPEFYNDAKDASTALKRNINIVVFIIAVLIFLLGFIIEKNIIKHIKQLSNLLTSLAPITGKEIKIDITTPQGMDEALKTVDEAIKVTQESIKKAEEATKAKSLFLANMSHESEPLLTAF